MPEQLETTTPYSWPALREARVAAPLLAGHPVLPNAAAPTDPATVLPEERRAAREQGYAEGLRQGRDEAQAEQAAVLAEVRACAERFIDELAAEKARARETLRWLLQTLAEELSVQQLNRSPELLDRLLDEAVGDVGLPTQSLTVHVAPGLETWWQENEFRDDVSVQIDTSLPPGRVQFRTPARVAEFDPRALVNRLLNAAPQSSAEASSAVAAPEPTLEPAPGEARDAGAENASGQLGDEPLEPSP